jgi:hypothetical protein
MKAIRFYLEYPTAADKRTATRAELGNHTGNVIATFDGTEAVTSQGPQVDALAAIFDRPNSPVAGTAVSLEYIRERAKRISEAQARQIHPELFNRLDE